MTKKQEFNNFRFEGLHAREMSNKYYHLNRVSDDKNKIVVKVASEHLLKTQYGYALILNSKQVVFLKEWQVDMNWYGNEVILSRDYFIVKNWGDFPNFSNEELNNKFEDWLEIAKEQDSLVDEEGFPINSCHWKK